MQSKGLSRVFSDTTVQNHPTHVARLEFPPETGLILRCTRKAGNPFQRKQGNRLSCRDQEGNKFGLKLNIQKTKIMASGPITSWEIDGETVESVSDFIFLGSKITTDDDCSNDIKRHLLLGRIHLL